ncbi:enolase-phosphatase E1 [Octopus vulgaris]|uniref:Enolase-phosphatase E1 n=1 Tax=Octopus vulgaris TaxID=6645 RepID=A0AA36BIE8_OCTVU|nr:enolase-phosphatase E1 [Octopus vulgaris]
MGMKHYIYSSGSIASQKLLFSHVPEGNIIDLFSGFFDTLTGSKVESESYKKIVEEVNVKADEIMFLTDNPKEVAAATSAGVKCRIVIRDGNEALSEDDLSKFCTIHSFTELIKKEESEPSVSKKKNLKTEK